MEPEIASDDVAAQRHRELSAACREAHDPALRLRRELSEAEEALRFAQSHPLNYIDHPIALREAQERVVQIERERTGAYATLVEAIKELHSLELTLLRRACAPVVDTGVGDPEVGDPEVGYVVVGPAEVETPLFLLALSEGNELSKVSSWLAGAQGGVEVVLHEVNRRCLLGDLPSPIHPASSLPMPDQIRLLVEVANILGRERLMAMLESSRGSMLTELRRETDRDPSRADAVALVDGLVGRIDRGIAFLSQSSVPVETTTG